jgi:hypothetical protein
LSVVVELLVGAEVGAVDDFGLVVEVDFPQLKQNPFPGLVHVLASEAQLFAALHAAQER